METIIEQKKSLRKEKNSVFRRLKKNCVFSKNNCPKICVYQKKAIPLRSLSEERGC